MTSTEFLEALEWIEDEPNRFNPLYWYLAQIAYEICRNSLRYEYQESMSIKTFLLSFKTEERPRPIHEYTPEEREKKIREVSALHKAALMAATGARPDG